MLRWTPLTILGLCVALAVGFAVQDGALRTSGPLRVSAAYGGSVSEVPKVGESRWVAVGEIVLCTTDGDPVVLRRVRVHTPVRPRSARVYLRTVPAVAVLLDGRVPSAYDRVGMLRGLPPHFVSGADGGWVMAGTWSERIRGSVITQRCDDQRRLGHGFTELVVAFRAGPRGARIGDVDVDYEWHHRLDTATSRGDAAVCGTAITEPGVCGNPED